MTEEYTGGSVNYYKVLIDNPTSCGDKYIAECNDIIEALKMNYAEGNAFKAIWRSCAARNLGLLKTGYKDGKYDAEKVVFFGNRMLKQFEYSEDIKPIADNDGWIEWTGGECPTNYNQMVEIKCKDLSTDIDKACYYVWKHDGDIGDIIAYKLVK